MTFIPTDPQVKALINLCNREGGYLAVAQKAKLNKDSLHQIVSGVKLLSGRAKGTGPNRREALDKSYPNWLSDELLDTAESRSNSWPFIDISHSEWDLISERTKGLIEGYARTLIDQDLRRSKERQRANES